ncbi:hypothetical protein [Phenylobacterium sp.]|jgi:hypothetical protein|uniref:hypothetical protein n=1 Tax=Phenylobacterium sp. TaxID=1871053 RepID=UPI002F4061BF
MTKAVLTALILTLAAGALSACATYPVRERVVVGERGPWVGGHYDRFGAWIPGHYR